MEALTIINELREMSKHLERAAALYSKDNGNDDDEAIDLVETVSTELTDLLKKM